MKKVLTLIFILTTFLAYSQEISRSINASSGGTINDSEGYTVDWTMGTQFSQTIRKDHHVTEGFQQGNYKKVSLEEEINEMLEDDLQTDFTKESNNLNYSVFPNPTKHQLFLNVDNDNFQTAEVIVFDKIGKEVMRTQIDAEQKGKIQIPGIQYLPAGVYLIQINTQFTPSQTLKFIKM